MGTLRRIRLGLICMVAFAGLLSGLPPSSRASTASTASEAAGSVTVTWSVQRRILDDRRSYYVDAPACAPADAPGCADFLRRPRSVVLWFHGAGGLEDPDTATRWLTALHGWGKDTLFVFGVSKYGTRVWDAGICCTKAPVDEIGYVLRVVDDLASRWSVDRDRVGVAGFSNGGMLAQRVACERPGAVAGASSLAGTFAGPCDVGRTDVAQWHGALDQPVPLNGGTSWVMGAHREFPPAASLSQRMVSGSTFELQVRPGAGHGLPWADYRESVRWLLRTIRAG